MDLFLTYFQPITNWVANNPQWALLATFIISFSESLAFIGTIIPGTVTMTAVGILAGSGVMRIDFTLIAAILGAIAGDSASYFIGRVFSDKLPAMWPFSRYPHWLNYAKEYFEHHGGKSVLIGRFTGPLRSVIPIIAGMMGMNRWHFLIANVTSAIGWSLLYIVPGILIGTASSELSPEMASKLFIVVLVLLAIIWALTLGIRWLFISINQWLHTYLNRIWAFSLRHRPFSLWTRYITPKNETDYYPTAMLALILISCIIFMPPFLYSCIYSSWIQSFNEAVYQFCLSIRTYDFDAIFIIVRLTISMLSISVLCLAIAIYATYHRDWRLLRFWTSLIVTSGLILWFLTVIMHSPDRTSPPSTLFILAFPTKGLTVATSLLSFLIAYMAAYYKQTLTGILRIILMISLLLSGIALVYLGEDWIMNVVIAYKIGFTNAVLHWMLYRRHTKPHYRSYLPMNLSIILVLVVTFILSLLFFNKIADTQQINTKQYIIHHKTWWHQKRPLLPLYTMNRFGKEMGVMNIQYIGSIESLRKSLKKSGWEEQPDSFFYSLLVRINNKKSAIALPLMAQLYQNEKPFFLMTNKSSTDNNGLIIRIWRSNYHVQDQHQIIWIGSIQKQRRNLQKNPSEVVNQLFPSLNEYKTKTIIVNPKKAQPNSSIPTILLLIEQ